MLSDLVKVDERSRKKALKGPKPMKYMDADGSHVKERPSNTTGTARDWLEISSSDDDSDSEPQTGIPLDPPAPPAARRAPTVPPSPTVPPCCVDHPPAPRGLSR